MAKKDERKRWSEDRRKRYTPKGPTHDGGGREKNVGHQNSEEHSRRHKGPPRKK